MLDAATAWRGELLDLMRIEWEEGLAVGRELTRCSSPQAAFAVQVAYLGKALERGMQRADRWLRLGTETLSGRREPFFTQR